MAYCSKCGVELEKNLSSCPLCHYQLPEDLRVETAIPAFPEVENAHIYDAQGFRNKIFYIYFMMCLAFITIALVLDLFFKLSDDASQFLKYGTLSVVSSLIYLFLLLGYIKKPIRIFTGLGITTVLFTLGLDALNGQVNWSVTYALPITLASAIIFGYAYKRYSIAKHSRHIIFIPVYVCLALCLLLPIIETVISLNLLGAFRLRWSLISTVSLFFFSMLISGVYFKMPKYIKERIIRLFHI